MPLRECVFLCPSDLGSGSRFGPDCEQCPPVRGHGSDDPATCADPEFDPRREIGCNLPEASVHNIGTVWRQAEQHSGHRPDRLARGDVPDVSSPAAERGGHKMRAVVIQADAFVDVALFVAVLAEAHDQAPGMNVENRQ
jgi:hypothetical protein